MLNRYYWRWGAHGAMFFGGFIAFLILILLIPIQAWAPPVDNVLIHQIDGVDARRARQVAEIYAVLQSRDMGLKQTTIWRLARCIQEESEKHSLAPALVLAIIEVESRFDHRAVSSQGARGLMQIRPMAAEAVAAGIDFPDGKTSKTLHDPIVNVKIGTAYLGYLKELFTDLKLALIAYNWGPTRLRQALATKTTVPRAYPNKVFVALRALENNWLHERSLQLAGEPHNPEAG